MILNEFHEFMKKYKIDITSHSHAFSLTDDMNEVLSKQGIFTASDLFQLSNHELDRIQLYLQTMIPSSEPYNNNDYNSPIMEEEVSTINNKGGRSSSSKPSGGSSRKRMSLSPTSRSLSLNNDKMS